MVLDLLKTSGWLNVVDLAQIHRLLEKSCPVYFTIDFEMCSDFERNRILLRYLMVIKINRRNGQAWSGIWSPKDIILPQTYPYEGPSYDSNELRIARSEMSNCNFRHALGISTCGTTKIADWQVPSQQQFISSHAVVVTRTSAERTDGFHDRFLNGL